MAWKHTSAILVSPKFKNTNLFDAIFLATCRPIFCYSVNSEMIKSGGTQGVSKEVRGTTDKVKKFVLLLQHKSMVKY